MGLGRLHGVSAHRNTSIIPASSGLRPKVQLVTLIGGAPGPGETAGRISRFPESGPVGPRAAGWIAGPSPSKRQVPISCRQDLKTKRVGKICGELLVIREKAADTLVLR